MSAEAEATDILVRMSMEGAQYFLRFGGEAAEKAFALFFALIKTVYERTRGHQKLGGKINPRTFLTNFTSSSVFPLSQEDFKKLKPELKRLHIPYMQYKTTKSMRDNETIEISVSKENAERFIRLAENLGIASVAPYDMHTDELTEAEYEQALKDGNAKGVDVSVSPDGITTVNERENPMQAPSDILNQSAPNSNEFEPFTLRFNETDGIRENLKLASLLQPPF